MAERALRILTLVTTMAVPAAAHAQSSDATSIWVGIGLSGEHTRFTHPLPRSWIWDIHGTEPALSVRLNVAARRVSVGLEVDMSSSHELEVRTSLAESRNGRTQVFENIQTVHDRFSTVTANVGYSLVEAKNWSTTVRVGIGFTRWYQSFSDVQVPPLPDPPARSSAPTNVRNDVGPSVGIEVGRALGGRWSAFGDFRVTVVGGVSPGFLLRPGVGLRLRL
jgi:hypothetical protein